ncbi:hypothetical protein ACH3XW_39135 [Acanthocheilonema viteae]
MKVLPSVLDGSEKNRVNPNEQFHFRDELKAEKTIRSFHKLEFNDSVIIRMKHEHYAYFILNKDQCIITFSFLDAHEVPVVQFRINPGIAQFSLLCHSLIAVSVNFPNNSYRKYYEFVILFSSAGIKLFYNEDDYMTTDRCVNRITEITKLSLSVIKAEKFEAMVEVQTEKSRIPSNWHIVKSIPINHKIVIDYYPSKNSIITIRVGDKNGIAALAVIVDYTKGILYTKRDRLDDKNVPCAHFDHSSLGRIEIAVFPHRYKIDIKQSRTALRNIMRGCLIYGHHLSPYDIQQTIIDSNNKNVAAFAHYIEPA